MIKEDSMDMHSMLRRAISVGRIYSLGAVAIFALAATAVPALAQDADALPSRVGRLSNAAGEIYLATQENADDWSPIQINYPVTSGDNLWAAEGARAEVDFGGSQMRMSASTNVSVSNLDDHNVEVFVAQGNVIVRVGVLDAGDSVVVDTPTTQVVLVRPGLYRIDVSPDQQQTTLTGRVEEGLRVESKMTGIGTDELLKRTKARIPLGRLGTPEEVARNEHSATGRFLVDLCGKIATTAAKTAVV
jgi:hypothetical protein